MKYIPGSAKLNIKKSHDKRYYNTFKIKVDYSNRQTNTLFCKELTELDILILAYLKLNRHKIPSNWFAEICSGENSHSIGGAWIKDNTRFDIFTGDNKWLYNYALLSNLLIDDPTYNSIDNIKITWYDEDSLSHKCKLPHLGELFDSENKFIIYVRDMHKLMSLI